MYWENQYILTMMVMAHHPTVSKAMEDMSVKKLEKLLSVKKKGRPSNAEKQDKAAKQRELDQKKGKGNPATE